jgi:hypothetical protein
VRIVIVDECETTAAEWRRDLSGYQGVKEALGRVETAYVFDRSIGLEVSPEDRFIATTWWTAHIAARACEDLGRKRFLYLVQEYEPLTFPAGTLYALASQSYNFPHRAVFSTELLRDFFREQRIGVFAEGEEAGDRNSIAFRNAITPITTPNAAELRSHRTKKLLFYARPEQHAARNMFDMAILALNEAIEDGAFGKDWEFYGIGTSGPAARVPLARRRELVLVPRQSQDDYANLLPGYDLGLSLMYTPHPSLVPLEMASAGMLVVTNTYDNKTASALQEISSNLFGVEPSIEEVARALASSARRIDDVDARVRGAGFQWPRTWSESFNDGVMASILEFLRSA